MKFMVSRRVDIGLKPAFECIVPLWNGISWKSRISKRERTAQLIRNKSEFREKKLFKNSDRRWDIHRRDKKRGKYAKTKDALTA